MAKGILQQVRMIVTDLDGTLLGRNSEVVPENAAALRRAAAQGLIVAFASGRLPAVCSRIALNAGLTGCRIIGMNGAMIWDAPYGGVIRETFYPRPLAEAVVGILRAEGCVYNVYTTGGVYTNRRMDDEEADRFRRRFSIAGVPVVIAEDAGERALSVSVAKFLVKQGDTAEGFRRARQQVSALPGIYLTASSADNFEVMQDGIGKAEAVRLLAARLSISMDSVMAFGDFDNDIGMLKACGYPVAMGNASDAAKNAAKYITADHMAGGVGYAVDALLDGRLDALQKA